MKPQPVAVGGVWTRTRGGEQDKRIEVLVEVAGEWRLIQSHPAFGHYGEISHITEPGGIESAQKDVL